MNHRLFYFTSVLCISFFTAIPLYAQLDLRGEDHVLSHLPLRPGMEEYWQNVIHVSDDPDIKATGQWDEGGFRRAYPAQKHLRTEEDGATLERTFESAGLVLVLESHMSPAFRGRLNDGILEISVDGEVTHVINVLTEANEIVLYRDLKPQSRQILIHHRHAPNGGRGARVIGFRELHEPTADLSFSLTATASDLLNDARITILDGDKTLFSVVQRNWMSGMVRLAGLPPGEGYTLRIDALGWESVIMPLPPLHASSDRILTPVHLPLDDELLTEGFVTPRLGYPAVKRPGDLLNLHFSPHQNESPFTLLSLRWEQTIGTAKRRVLLWEGSEIISSDGLQMEIALPEEQLDGMGDLVADVKGQEGMYSWRAPRSLHMRESYPDQPTFITTGHLCVWGHYQGEYLTEISRMINLINPDAVLFSNEVHPVYTAGGLKQLQIPYLITIGNHAIGYEENPSYFDADGHPRPGPEFPLSYSLGQVDQFHNMHRGPQAQYELRDSRNRAFDRWFGDPIGVFELSPDITVLNYGWKWNTEFNGEAIEIAKNKFKPFIGSRIRAINSFEGDPAREFLDEHDFALFHTAHAWVQSKALYAENPASGPNQNLHYTINDGATTFVGMHWHDNFRVVHFENDRVDSLTYVSADRHRVAPLRVDFLTTESSSDISSHRAQLINDFSIPYQNCRIDWVLPYGRYQITGGSVQGQWDSDDGDWTVLTVMADAPANTIQELKAESIAP